MKKNWAHIIWILFVCIGCSKSSTKQSNISITWSGNLIPYSPVPVTKTISKRVFVHFMPWFETKQTNGGTWGQHWTMANENPEIVTNGQRQIASYYYPMNIGAYASSDTNVIDYQLLLMKLSGIDGVFIDWPGTMNYSDFPQNVANTNVIVSRLAKAGLHYAIVYEDQNLSNTSSATQMSQAQSDMRYIQNNYFNNIGSTYETLNGKPLLLDFGPFGPLQTASDWNSIFSVMTTPPAYITYEDQSSKGGTNAAGEFAWVQQSNLSNLTSFYGNGYSGAKFCAAYPGFNDFYVLGGWPNTAPFTVAYNSGSTTTFQQTVDLALQQTNSNYIQIVTWNDYGEGTMIEPTVQFGYSYLTTLQQKLGVSSLSQTDLEAVAKLYTSRLNNILPVEYPDKLTELNQIYYFMVSMKMDSAEALLQKDF